MQNLHPFDKENILSSQQLLALMPGIVYCKNMKGKYSGCNKKMLDIFNMKYASQLLGKDDIDMLGESSRN
jgi:hypothetical protein